MSVKLFCVEGPIAAGKSTTIRILEDAKIDGVKIIFLSEPIESWRSVGGMNLLDEFYKDQSRWALLFQIEAYTSRLKMVEKAIKENEGCGNVAIVIERSWINDRMVFGHLLHKDGKMLDMEWEAYCNLHEFLLSKAPKIDAMIYLDTSPEECLRRKKHRAREEEEATPDDYILRVAERYAEVSNGPGAYLTQSCNSKEILDIISSHF